MNEVLEATSTVIELKEGKRYLFVFKGDLNYAQLEAFARYLRQLGITQYASILLGENDSLEVIEVPSSPPPSPDKGKAGEEEGETISQELTVEHI